MSGGRPPYNLRAHRGDLGKAVNQRLRAFRTTAQQQSEAASTPRHRVPPIASLGPDTHGRATSRAVQVRALPAARAAVLANLCRCALGRGAAGTSEERVQPAASYLVHPRLLSASLATLW